MIENFEKNKLRRCNRHKSGTIKRIASSRIKSLFFRAEMFFNKFNSKDYANTCVFLARRISLKHKVPFSRAQKILFCKFCNSYLKPGETARIRFRKGKQIVLCLNCKRIKRYGYK